MTVMAVAIVPVVMATATVVPPRHTGCGGEKGCQEQQSTGKFAHGAYSFGRRERGGLQSEIHEKEDAGEYDGQTEHGVDCPAE